MFNNYIGAVTGENLDEHSLHVCWEETLTAVPRLPDQTSRFYEICVAPPTFLHLLIHPPPLPPPPATDFALNPNARSQWGTETASARAQFALSGLNREWALPGLNCERQSSVGTTAGPQPRAPELSGHCRTSTARSRSQWALRDLNCECKMPHTVECHIKCQKRCQIEGVIECQSICQKDPERMSNRIKFQNIYIYI